MSNDIVDNVQMDVDGYLRDGDDWSEAVAFELASAAGIRRLSGDHWTVIRALRNAYSSGEPDLFPRMPKVCAESGLDEGCVADLFGDPLVAWQVAGLPKSAVDMSSHMPGSDRV